MGNSILFLPYRLRSAGMELGDVKQLFLFIKEWQVNFVGCSGVQSRVQGVWLTRKAVRKGCNSSCPRIGLGVG